MVRDERLRRLILQFTVFAGMSNFAVFWLAALYLGGDAVNGHAAGGHYFLSNHGRFTEVSRSVFTYSKWHARSLWVSHPLAMVCGWLAYRGPSK